MSTLAATRDVDAGPHQEATAEEIAECFAGANERGNTAQRARHALLRDEMPDKCQKRMAVKSVTNVRYIAGERGQKIKVIIQQDILAVGTWEGYAEKHQSKEYKAEKARQRRVQKEDPQAYKELKGRGKEAAPYQEAESQAGTSSDTPQATRGVLLIYDLWGNLLLTICGMSD